MKRRTYPSSRRLVRSITKTASKLGEGLFAYSVDLSLWTVAFISALGVPQRTYGQIYRAGREADIFLSEINYEILKNGIREARRRGFLSKAGRGRKAWPEITEEGKRRLANLIPHYDEKRVWDGRIHIITYDVPEKQRNERELLRESLLRIGCGRLQDSVFMTPYNPIETLKQYIDEHGLHGTLIVSDLGKDGSVGDETLAELIIRVYKLHDLNEKYNKWLDQYDGERIDQASVIEYLNILSEDPQLPFLLLPKWWKGEEVYDQVKPLLQNLC